MPAPSPDADFEELYTTQPWAREMLGAIVDTYRNEADPSPELTKLTDNRCDCLELTPAQRALVKRLSETDQSVRDIAEAILAVLPTGD